MARKRKGFFARFRRSLRWALRLLLIFLVIDLIYVAVIWPDWKHLASGAIPKSSFMQLYEAKQKGRDWPKLQWQPVSLARIPRHMQRAVIVAEDSRFYEHSGFDLIAIREALDYNIDRGRVVFGASTITQQTVKNLYLSPSRNPLRKWHEMFLTWGIEHHLRKSRILELYLNIVEFGRGIYGVQAAARHYYGEDVEQLTMAQAAELAATLPSPVKNNPGTRTQAFDRRVQRILNLLTREQNVAAAAVTDSIVAPARDPAPTADPREAAPAAEPESAESPVPANL